MEGLLARLASIRSVEQDLEALQSASTTLGTLRDPSAVPAVLAVLERCRVGDDFGLLHGMGQYLARQAPDATIAGHTVLALVQASAERAPTWQTLWVLASLSPPGVEGATLERILRKQPEDELVSGIRERLAELAPEEPQAAPPPPAPHPSWRWWVRPVRGGILDLHHAPSDQDLQELLAHRESLPDAVLALRTGALSAGARAGLADLDRPLWLHEAYVADVERDVRILRERLWGVSLGGSWSRGGDCLLRHLHSATGLHHLDLGRLRCGAAAMGELLGQLPRLSTLRLADRSHLPALAHLPAPARLQSLFLDELLGASTHSEDEPLTARDLKVLRDLPGLEVLSLSTNRLSRRALRHLADTSALRQLDLLDCAWDRPDLGFLGGLPSLVRLGLVSRATTTPRADDTWAMHLSDLPAQVPSTLPLAAAAAIGRCTGLEALTLGADDLGDALVERLGALHALRSLDLYAPEVTSASLEVLATLPRLERLALRHTRVDDAGIHHLGALQLVGLVLDGVPGLTDASVGAWSALGGLTELTVRGSSLSRVGLANLRAALPQVQVRDQPLPGYGTLAAGLR